MFQLLLTDSESTITIMHQQNVTLNETCSVSWSLVHSYPLCQSAPMMALIGHMLCLHVL